MKEKIAYFVRHYIKAYGVELYFEMPLPFRKKMIMSDVRHWDRMGISPTK